jgi:polyphosphate kinase
MDRRIELLINMTDKRTAKRVRKIFIDTWLDTANTWLLEDDLEWHQMSTDETYYNVQDAYTRRD